MSETNEFISEVTKAAHQLQTLGQDEAHHLILRSVTEIRTMRERVGIPCEPWATILDGTQQASADE